MVKFPLDHTPFRPLHLIDSDKELLVGMAEDFVAEMMNDYEEHLHYCNGIVDATKWIRLKQFEDVVVFEDRQALKQRRLSRVSSARNDRHETEMLKLLWAGTIQGNLDDIMYAVVDRSEEEVKVKAAYLESNVLDFAVLETITHPTVDDPFRSLQVKWAVNGGPTMMRSVVRCRDFVYFESTGTTTLSTGERVGFQLLHSVSIPGAPELHQHKIVRGNMTLFHFFRQKSEGVVDTYVKAFIDLKGDMPLRVATSLSTSGVVSVWKLGEYALMKKLNWKLSQRRAILPSDRARLCHICKKAIQGSVTRRRTCKICVHQCCARCCVPKKMIFLPSRSRAVVQKAADVCTECIRDASYKNGMDVALDELSKAKTSNQHKTYSYMYWPTDSPTSSSSSIML